MPEERLKDRVAVVTGAGRGIGRTIALLMAEEGARVVVNDLGCEVNGSGAANSPADEVAKEIKDKGGIAVANYDSVATRQGGENIVKTAMDSFGHIDILVNNAGIVRNRMIVEMSEEEWDAVIKTHLYGHFYCTQPACTYMKQRGWGRIVNISSRAGLGTMIGQANYSAAKEGIIGFTRTVAMELSRFGVTCNAIRVRGATRMSLDPENEATLKRLGLYDRYAGQSKQIHSLAAEDNAPLAVYLASDEAANINGCVFMVVGGEIGMFEPQPVPQRTIYKDGHWTVAELSKVIPDTLAQGLVRPS